jgi:hypothetical protein
VKDVNNQETLLTSFVVCMGTTATVSANGMEKETNVDERKILKQGLGK